MNFTLPYMFPMVSWPVLHATGRLARMLRRDFGIFLIHAVYVHVYSPCASSAYNNSSWRRTRTGSQRQRDRILASPCSDKTTHPTNLVPRPPDTSVYGSLIVHALLMRWPDCVPERAWSVYYTRKYTIFRILTAFL